MNTMKLSQRVWQDPIYFIAFGFGSGLLPIAPGTWGTLAAIPIYLLLAGTSPMLYCFWTLLAFLLGVYVCEKVSNELGVHDYSGIVWDEIVGYLITMFLVPANLIWMMVGFLLFRLFDVWKPWPIHALDKHVRGGLGVMLDDVAAAVPAWCILYALVWILT